MDIACEYCNYQFKNKSSLNYHQKNTKYCLEIQGKTHSNFKCDTCNKFLSSNHEMAQAQDFFNWYHEIPPISRLYFTAAVSMTTACFLDFFSKW